MVGPAVDTRLRERWFGELDGGPDDPAAEGSVGGYPAIWAADEVDAAHEDLGVESVLSVVRRASALVAELESLEGPPLLPGSAAEAQYRAIHQAADATHASTPAPTGEQRWGVVLVAHGDVLQILQTAFERSVPPAQHRSLEHLENAQPRWLN